MWNKVLLIFFGVYAVGVGVVHGEEGEVGARISWQQNKPSSSSFSVQESFRPVPARLTQQELYMHIQQGVLTFRGLATATQQANGGYHQEKATINELYADFSLSDLDASIGKKVVSWGVGYGYRPLDVIQRESRQTLRTFDLEGVPMLEMEYFTAESAVTVIVANRLRFDGISPTNGAYEGALKYSTLLGNSDLHLLLYQRQGESASVASGTSTTYGEHLEWHASMRYLPSYNMLKHRLSGQVPSLLVGSSAFETQKKHNGIQALLGASWTWENGCSLMLEAWHDDTAWSRNRWQELLHINNTQHQMLHLGAPTQAVYGNISANNQVYSQQNLLKDTLFMRLSYDGDAFDPDISLLYTPVDGGAVLTASADYKWSDSVQLFGNARIMGGKKNSAYNNTADRWQLFIGLEISGAVP